MLQRLPQETNSLLCYKVDTTSVNLFFDFTISTESGTLCNTVHTIMLSEYEVIMSAIVKDTFFLKNVTSREKNILSGNDLQL